MGYATGEPRHRGTVAMVTATATMNMRNFVEEMISAGFTERQAGVIARHRDAVHAELAARSSLSLEIEPLKKDLLLKLGGIFVGGCIATIGILLFALPMMI